MRVARRVGGGGGATFLWDDLSTVLSCVYNEGGAQERQSADTLERLAGHPLTHTPDQNRPALFFVIRGESVLYRRTTKNQNAPTTTKMHLFVVHRAAHGRKSLDRLIVSKSYPYIV